jgi:single-strand DNA-binding protein
MSRSLNKVQLIGNLGNDPEIRTTTGGSKVAQFSIATMRTWNSANGEKQEKTEWHKAICWNRGTRGGLADIIEKYVKKGDKIYVEGRIEYRSFEDKEKQTRYVTEINVDQVLLLGGKGGSNSNDEAPRERATAGAGAPATNGVGANSGSDFEEFPGALNGEEDSDLPFDVAR